MKAIDPNAVIDAIARLFPDGIDCSEHGSGDAAEWHTKIAYDLGIYDEEGDFFDVLDETVGALMKADRLRELPFSDGGWYVLSYAEQACRIALALGINNAFDERCEAIANVLAGKTAKKA